MVGVAVKVTLVPEQIAPEGDADMVTEGVRFGFTVIVIPGLVAVAVVTHVSLLVNTQVTTSLLDRFVAE